MTPSHGGSPRYNLVEKNLERTNISSSREPRLRSWPLVCPLLATAGSSWMKMRFRVRTRLKRQFLQNGLFCLTSGNSPKGPYTGQFGFLGYYEIMQALNNDTWAEQRVTISQRDHFCAGCPGCQVQLLRPGRPSWMDATLLPTSPTDPGQWQVLSLMKQSSFPGGSDSMTLIPSDWKPSLSTAGASLGQWSGENLTFPFCEREQETRTC